MAENEVKIHITTTDDTAAGRGKTREDFQKLGDDVAGDLDKRLSDGGSKAGKDGGNLAGIAMATALSLAAPIVGSALIGGVAAGFVGVAALVQKNNADVKASFGDLGHQVVGEMQSATNQVVPYLVGAGHALQQEFANLGPQLHDAFSYAGPDIKILTAGVDNFANAAMPGLVGAMANSEPIIHGISDVMGSLGNVVTDVLGSVGAHSAEFGHDLTQIGTLTQNVGSVVAGVLPGLASGFGSTVGAVNTLLTDLKPIAPELGTIAGQALPIFGMSKFFGAASGAVDTLGGKLQDTGKSMTEAGGATGKVGGFLSSAGKAASGFASALPFVGAAVGLVTTVIGDSDQKFQSWQQGLLAGGEAAKTALSGFEQQVGFMPGAYQKLLDGLTPLQKAQLGFNSAVAEYGANSSQAASAQKTLASANETDQQTQRNLNQALLTTNESLFQQETLLLSTVDANLSLQSSALGVQSAEKNYADTVKSSGVNSVAAKEAFVGLQQAQTSEAHAAAQSAAAQNANASASDKAKAESNAYTASVLGMAAAANGHLTPALQQMVNGLTQTQISAFTATGKVQGTHQAILAINGKSVSVNVDGTGQAVANVNSLKNAVNGLSSKTITVQVNTIANAISDLLGGAPHRVSGGPTGLSRLSHYDTGGAVGDLSMNEHGGEAVRLPTGSMVIPNSSADQAARTAFERSGMDGGGGAGLTLTFAGDLNSAMATAIMKIFRSGDLQLVDSNNKRIKVG